MEYGTQVATATPASCLELQLHSVWETGCWRSTCHLCFLSTKLRTCIHEVRMPPLCFSMRAQPGYRAAELCAADSAAEQSTKRPGCRVYLHFGELAQCLYLHCLRSTITEPRLCTRTQALPQCLPVLPPVDYRPWTCICTHTRVNWRSTCRHCLLWTTLPSCVPAHILERDSSTLQTLPPVDTGPGRVPARTSVRVGTALTGVASHRQAVLDKYMHTWSVKLAQCIPVHTGVASC